MNLHFNLTLNKLYQKFCLSGSLKSWITKQYIYSIYSTEDNL